VAATPPPAKDPLAKPAARKGQGKKNGEQGGDLALVAAIRGKVRSFSNCTCHPYELVAAAQLAPVQAVQQHVCTLVQICHVLKTQLACS
jgi:hypothetical protein